jgi:ferric-dicitrate binding protein FerR (iron transport regulator)
MNRFEELFHRWQARDMSQDEFDEFSRMLKDESNKDRLYEELRFSGAIVEVLKATEETADEAAPVGSGDYEPGRESPAHDVPGRRVISWRLWGAMAACLAIAASLYFVGSRPDRPASESSLTHVAPAPPLPVLRDVALPASIILGEDASEAAAGMRLAAGSEIWTGGHGHAAVAYADGTVIRIGAETVVKLGGEEAGKRLFVGSGRLEANVAPQEDGREMVVATPHVAVTVIGTRFSVLVEEESTRVETTQGTVRAVRADVEGVTEMPAGKFLAAGGDGKQTTGALPKMKFELPLRLDCNTKISPTQEGFTPFPRMPKPHETGYGWMQFRRPLMADRGGPDDLRRDMHYWNGTKTFVARLPNGFYRVTVHFGDSVQANPNVRVYAEERLRLAAVSTEKGKFRSETFIVGVFDGQLALRFANDRSTNSSWAINALEIDRAE